MWPCSPLVCRHDNCAYSNALAKPHTRTSSIFGGNRYCMPLQAPKGNAGAWRVALDPFHSFFCINFSGASIRVHMRSKCMIGTFRLKGFPLMILNVQLFPVYNEIASNTQKRMNLVIGASLGSATITYEIISVFGYITFGTNVSVTGHTLLRLT